jgi:hypothetical protein
LILSDCAAELPTPRLGGSFGLVGGGFRMGGDGFAGGNPSHTAWFTPCYISVFIGVELFRLSFEFLEFSKLPQHEPDSSLQRS